MNAAYDTLEGDQNKQSALKMQLSSTPAQSKEIETGAKAVINWQLQYGRHDLPWQKKPTPYRVWVSEIMLQQTQVSTVIAYFQRFMRALPSLKQLACASPDTVLALWSGLGYYTRARNLHQTAQIIHHQHQGRFPKSIEALIKLPGIGRSTAGAILSLAHREYAVILDGNVKRVIARHFAIPGWPGKTTVHKHLWTHATLLTPTRNTHIYNQAMMDLGATLCTRNNPRCLQCPLQTSCIAFATHTTTHYPEKKPRAHIPTKHLTFLIIQSKDKQKVLLEKRPDAGIWGGLWSFPEAIELSSARNHWSKLLASKLTKPRALPKLRHRLTHMALILTPMTLTAQTLSKQSSVALRWHALNEPLPGGIAKPVQTLLKQLKEKHSV